MPVNVHCDGPDCDEMTPFVNSAELHQWYTVDSAHDRWYFHSGWCIARWAASWANLPNTSTINADGIETPPPSIADWVEIDTDPEEDPHG